MGSPAHWITHWDLRDLKCHDCFRTGFPVYGCLWMIQKDDCPHYINSRQGVSSPNYQRTAVLNTKPSDGCTSHPKESNMEAEHPQLENHVWMVCNGECINCLAQRLPSTPLNQSLQQGSQPAKSTPKHEFMTASMIPLQGTVGGAKFLCCVFKPF